MAMIDWLLCRLHLCRAANVRRAPTQYYYVLRCERCGHVHEDDV
jgi:uncharacterized Zn finger protein